MRTIKVLGSGCANCRATAQRVEDVAKVLGVSITVEKIESLPDIVAYGVLATPGVVVDGEVVHAGGVPSREKIAGWLAPGGERDGAAASPASACGCGGRG